MKHLVFDIETHPSLALCGDSRGAQEEFARREFDWDGTESDFPFLPLHYHQVWITCWLCWDEKTDIITRGTLLGKDAVKILQHRGRLVTFNGRSFDVPLLEMLAYSDPGFKDTARWFANTGPSYTQARNRYNSDRHWDVYEFSSNFGASRPGSLDNHATRLGVGGKQTLEKPFHLLYWEEEHETVIEYCQRDVEVTFAVYKRQLELVGL